MSPDPRIAVVLTSFNHSRYLRSSIDSVLQQTFSDFDLIIWDDGSTDDSWEIICSYSDPRIRRFRNTDSKSGWGFRRGVLEVRQGDYIAIQHSDDIWEPEKLEKQLEFMEANADCGAIFSNALTIRADGAPYRNPLRAYYSIFDQPNRTRFEWLNQFFYRGNVLCHPSVLLRRSCFDACGGYRFGFAQIGDMDLWVRICLKYEIHVLPERLVRFRFLPSGRNASANRRDVRVRAQFELLQIYRNYAALTNREDFIRIFPALANYAEREQPDLGFALAMAALQPGTNRVARLFGLELLFQALNSPVRARRIKQTYSFDHSDFVRLTGHEDVFALDLMTEARFQLAERLSRLLRQLRSLLAPRGSWRRRLLERITAKPRRPG